MSSLWSSVSFGVLVRFPKHSHNNARQWAFPQLRRRTSSFFGSPISTFSGSYRNSAFSEQLPVGYDPEELLDIPADLQPRKSSKQRSWFGPNGQYIRELPCPNCRGRGYTPCTQCGIERPRPDCLLCKAKGMISCDQCHGDCVIWEESIDERPWENARSVSPLRVKEDEEVDDLEIKLDVKRKRKRNYQSSAPEVNLKISRSLKILNEKTGLFSNKMKIIHRDPMLRAQRVAAIKKAKGSPAARRHASETMKKYFSDPENRRKRSISMKGVKFHCQNCGGEGHRRNYCPNKETKAQFKCRICGGKGHNRRTCPRSKSIEKTSTQRGDHHCKICGQRGHNRRTCAQMAVKESPLVGSQEEVMSRRRYTCHLCHQKGHSMRTCPLRNQHSKLDSADHAFHGNAKV